MATQMTDDERRAAVNRRGVAGAAIDQLVKAHAVKMRGKDAEPQQGEWREVASEVLARVDADELRRAMAELADEYGQPKEQPAPPVLSPASTYTPKRLVNPFAG